MSSSARETRERKDVCYTDPVSVKKSRKRSGEAAASNAEEKPKRSRGEEKPKAAKCSTVQSQKRAPAPQAAFPCQGLGELVAAAPSQPGKENSVTSNKEKPIAPSTISVEVVATPLQDELKSASLNDQNITLEPTTEEVEGARSASVRIESGSDCVLPNGQPQQKQESLQLAQALFLEELNKIVGAISTCATSAERHTCTTNAQGEAASWEERYNYLFALRQTEAEAQLESFRTHTAEKEAAQNALMEKLRASLAVGGRTQAVPETQITQSEDAAGEPPAESRLHTLEQKIERQRALITLYQQLSSLALSFDPNDTSGTEVICTAVNHIHKRALRFNLQLPQGDGDEGSEELRYTPVSNTELLPEYMQHSLCFASSHCPLFLVKVLQSLFHQ